MSNTPVKILQITDTHLFADPASELWGMNTDQSFRDVLALVKRFNAEFNADLAVLTGDLVHDEKPEGYRRLAAYLAELDMPVYCIPGNHDEKSLLNDILPVGQVEVADFVDVGGWRILFVDTAVPGEKWGHLAPTELQKIRKALESASDNNVALFLHHQPVPVGSEWLDTMCIDNADELFAITDTHSHVRAIIWGHVHQTFDSERNGVRLLATPSTCGQFLPLSKSFALDDKAMPGFRWIELYSDGAVVTEIDRLPTSLG